ncbi:hypothetical protein AB4Z17_11640 [Paenibacillus sp. TAF43_2]|uniref:hypothetical protein n=1 Tax=Paenibacillus sp. TAF43_2 TaxID=3233069 RepID=UPI003F9E8EEF
MIKRYYNGVTCSFVEAVKFNGNFDEIEKFVGGDADFRNGGIVVATLDGPLFAKNGDYIIKDPNNKFSACPALDFINRYNQQ